MTRYVAAPGLTVRDPRTRQIIDEGGIEVGPHDFDLNRMVAQGDLVEAKAAPAPAAVPATPAAPPTPAAPIAPAAKASEV